MSEKTVESIKSRLKELEAERKKLLSDLSQLQSQKSDENITLPPIGASSTPIFWAKFEIGYRRGFQGVRLLIGETFDYRI